MTQHGNRMEVSLTPRAMDSSNAQIRDGDPVRLSYVLQVGMRMAVGIERLGMTAPALQDPSSVPTSGRGFATLDGLTDPKRLTDPPTKGAAIVCLRRARKRLRGAAGLEGARVAAPLKPWRLFRKAQSLGMMVRAERPSRAPATPLRSHSSIAGVQWNLRSRRRSETRLLRE